MAKKIVKNVAKSAKNVAKKVSKTVKAKKAAKVVRERPEHIALAYADNAKVSSIDMSSMREGSSVHKRFAKVRKGMTIGAIKALDGGPTGYDLACAFNRDRIAFTGPKA